MIPESAPSVGMTENEFRERLSSEPPPEWVREMLEFYRQNGYYRPEDIIRLLGDQTRPTVIGQFGCLSTSTGP